MSQLTNFVIITGMTGAGRSTAAKAMEKLGYFVVDNLPPTLMREVVKITKASADIDRLAIVVDARSGELFAGLTAELEDLHGEGLVPKILYLEAADEVLVRRQEAARRPHPLSLEGRLQDGLDRERELLRTLRGRASLVIDTSSLNTHQLGQRIRAAFDDPKTHGLRASVVSFGFKYGIPIDADMVADMRFLPNPFWDEDLRPLSGLDEPVRDYVLSQPEANKFLDTYETLISLLTNGFIHQDKEFLTIAIGCTGGKHRSVAMSEALAERLRAHGVNTLVVHRDLGRE